MRTMKHLGLTAVAVAALALASCGGGGSPKKASDDPDPTPKTGTILSLTDVDPGDATKTVRIQTTGIEKAVAAAPATGLVVGGDDGIAVGEDNAITVGGVKFTCVGNGKCTVTLTMNATSGNIEAAWTAGTAEGSMVMTSFVDPLMNMNEANEAKVAAIMMRPIGSAYVAATTGDNATPAQIAGANDTSVLGGLKDGTLGLGASDMSGVTLRGPLNPNASDFNANDTTNNLGFVAATADAGSTMTAKDNDVGADRAGALGLMDWSHRLLHADWGDTAGGLDAGVETAALIYSNMAAPAAVAFEDVADMVAARGRTNPQGADGDNGLHTWFAITVRYDTGAAGNDTNDVTADDNTAVKIDDAGATDNDVPTQVANAKISPTGQTFSGLVAHPDDNDEIQGTYFGAAGTFKCNNADCQISRETTGATPFTLADGEWLFKPDAGATVMLPDQDWLSFGVWLTAPDNMADGVHYAGVFYDGMERYGIDDNTVDGTAKYAGKAAGYYVNGTEHGLFTADAALTATFADAGNTLKGTIQNFRNSRGGYIDSDNPDTPNHPGQGGENDWGVNLASHALNASGTFDTAGTTSGTADGVSWSGDWMAQLYGPDRGTPVPAPSGVAGNFRAITGALTGGGYKGVVGGFGADQSNWTPAATTQ